MAIFSIKASTPTSDEYFLDTEKGTFCRKPKLNTFTNIRKFYHYEDIVLIGTEDQITTFNLATMMGNIIYKGKYSYLLTYKKFFMFITTDDDDSNDVEHYYTLDGTKYNTLSSYCKTYITKDNFTSFDVKFYNGNNEIPSTELSFRDDVEINGPHEWRKLQSVEKGKMEIILALDRILYEKYNFELSSEKLKILVNLKHCDLELFKQ